MPEEKIYCVKDELEAVDSLSFENVESIYILHGVDSWAVANKVKDKIVERIEEVAEK